MRNKLVKWKSYIVMILLAFGGTLFFPYFFQPQSDNVAYTNSILAFILFAFLIYILNVIRKKGFEKKKAAFFWPGIVGTLFTVSMIFGVSLDRRGNVDFTDWGMWGAILTYSILFLFIIRYIWDTLRNYNAAKSEKISMVADDKKQSRRYYLLTFLGIVLLYLPVFLAVFPGFFVYDAQDELYQVATRSFSTHHPLFHVLLMGGIIQLGNKISSSYNVGIALYTIFQMLVMAGIFSFVVFRMRKAGISSRIRVVTTLYFGLCPVLVMFSLCSAKDGLFAGMMLLLVICIKKACEEPGVFFQKASWGTLWFVSSIGMMLFRHNGFYAFLVAIPFLIIALKKYWKKTLIYTIISIAVFFFIQASLVFITHAEKSEHQEMLTVPIMQMARAYHYNKDKLPEEDLKVLYRYLPEEALDKYNPKLADMTKVLFNNKNYAEDKKGFLSLWMKWGMKYPSTYLNAWFMTSFGFWYPDTVIDVYRGNEVFTFTYEDSSYFGYEVEKPGERTSLIPWLDSLYRNMSLEITQQKIPVLSMIFSPGFLFWIMAFVLGFLAYQKQYMRMVPYFVPLLCWLTFLLGPTYLVRYVVFLWVLLPFLLLELFKKPRQSTERR